MIIPSRGWVFLILHGTCGRASHAEDAVCTGGSIARRSAADSQAAAQHVAGVTRILSNPSMESSGISGTSVC